MERVPIDHADVRRSLDGICFICELVAGNPDYFHHVFYENDETIAFLDKYPTLYGYALVAPKTHLEQVTGDLSEETYINLQRVVYGVGEAIRHVVPTERLYVLSLGSQQANRHIHWHVAPLPPGVPFDDQQHRALDRADYLAAPFEELAELAERLRSALLAVL